MTPSILIGYMLIMIGGALVGLIMDNKTQTIMGLIAIIFLMGGTNLIVM